MLTISINGTVSAQGGEMVNFTCFASGNPVPTITWYLGNEPASLPSTVLIENVTAFLTPGGNLSFTEGNVTSTLHISDISYLRHEGEYICSAMNNGSVSQESVYLSISG